MVAIAPECIRYRSTKSKEFLFIEADLLLLHGVKHICQSALAAVLTVEMCSHEDSSSTLFAGALASQPVDLAVVVHAVVLQHRQLDLLMLVFDLFGSGVILLLALLAATPQTEDQVKS